MLGWEPEVSFEELIRMMVDADLELLRHEISSRGVPVDVTGSAPGLNPSHPLATLNGRPRRVRLEPSQRTRVSSSANISAGSMQRSGGSAPTASSDPRANRRTAAAAGAAVETIEPPSPEYGRLARAP